MCIAAGKKRSDQIRMFNCIRGIASLFNLPIGKRAGGDCIFGTFIAFHETYLPKPLKLDRYFWPSWLVQSWGQKVQF